MSIEITLRCDALNCHNEQEIQEEDEHYIRQAGWLTDPRVDEFHYCPRCKPVVMKEMKEEGMVFDD